MDFLRIPLCATVGALEERKHGGTEIGNDGLLDGKLSGTVEVLRRAEILVDNRKGI